MPPRKFQISQEAFDAAVKENEEVFEMDKEEAIKEAVTTFELQGADLSGIITTPGPRDAANGGEPRVVSTVRQLVAAIQLVETATGATFGGANANGVSKGPAACETVREEDVETMPAGKSTAPQGTPAGIGESERGDVAGILTSALEELQLECEQSEGDQKSNVAATARKAGAVESVMRASLAAQALDSPPTLAAALRTTLSVLQDGESRDKFYEVGGCKVVASAIEKEGEDPLVAELGPLCLAAAATKQEAAKEYFMDLNAHCTCVTLLLRHMAAPSVVSAACDAMRSLVTADDTRVPSSRAFGNARNLAKAGAIEAILAASTEHRTDQTALRTLCLTLKSVAVNDEICKSVAEHGGIALTLSFAEECARRPNKAMGKATCALLCQLAGSDSNKEAIVEAGGLERLVALCSVYSRDAQVLQEALAALAALALRSAKNAALAFNVGAADVAVSAMEAHPSVKGVQRHACSLVRNLAVRNPENRPLIMEKGVEPLIRRLKAVPECKDAAMAALRDLGFDDYNK